MTLVFGDALPLSVEGSHPIDHLLRCFGWHVVSRPRGQESTWAKSGKCVPQSEAVAEVAKYLNQLPTGQLWQELAEKGL